MIFLLVFFNIILSECIILDTARLLEKPNINSKILWQVRKYFPLKLIKKTKDWSNVEDFRGDKYWVQNEILTREYKCLIVVLDELNIRTGPGINYDIKYKETAKKYDCYKLLERKNNWILFEDPYGDKGWLSEKGVWVY